MYLIENNSIQDILRCPRGYVQKMLAIEFYLFPGARAIRWSQAINESVEVVAVVEPKNRLHEMSQWVISVDQSKLDRDFHED